MAVDKAILYRLIQFQLSGVPVISLSVTFPPEEGLSGARTRVHSMLKQGVEMAGSDELSHHQKMSLRADIDCVHGLAELEDLVAEGQIKELSKSGISR